MPWMMALAVGGSALIGDVMSQQGQQQTNAMSQANMLQNEQWQTQMSDTQMQRRVTDLRAAGLNPMLAAGGPGAAMGSPVMPNLQNPSASFGQMGQQASNAIQATTTQSQISANQASAQQSAAQAALANAQAAKTAGVDTDMQRQNIAESQTHQALMNAQADAAGAAASLDRAQVDVAHAQLPKIQAEIAQLGASQSNQEAQASLARLEASMQGLNIAQFKLIAPQLVTQAINASQRSGVDLETAYSNYQRAKAQGAVYSGTGGTVISYLDTIFNWFHLGANISSSSVSKQ